MAVPYSTTVLLFFMKYKNSVLGILRAKSVGYTEYRNKKNDEYFYYSTPVYIIYFDLSLGVENEQTDAGRDGRTCLARLNYQARTVFPCLAGREQVWPQYPVDP